MGLAREGCIILKPQCFIGQLSRGDTAGKTVDYK
jgi:hypothetical protein